MHEKLREYRRKNFYRLLLLLGLVAAVAAIIYLVASLHVYTDYDIVSSVERTAISGATDRRLGKSVLTYSADGAHCTAADGSLRWNQTYEIQDLKCSVQDGTTAFASYNGRNVYVLDEKVQLGSFETNMPIRDIAVSKSGQVVTVMTDSAVTWINTYKPDGTEICEYQAHMGNSGYPQAVALSPSATLLAISFLYVDAGAIKSSVAFYNLGSVGENYNDLLVSGFDYTDMLVPEVGFLSDSVAYAVGDGRLMIYQGLETPTTKAEYLFDQEVRAVYSENGYLGLIFGSDDPEHRYMIKIYNSQGNSEGTFYFDMEYKDVLFEKSDFVIYNESECLIQTYDGREKFNGSFKRSVSVMVPTDKAYRYLLVSDGSLDVVQLK
jgi:hypothetical protein